MKPFRQRPQVLTVELQLNLFNVAHGDFKFEQFTSFIMKLVTATATLMSSLNPLDLDTDSEK
jgi:hypothetical protein